VARDTRGLGARGRRARSMYGFDEDPVEPQAVTKEETTDRSLDPGPSLPEIGAENPVGPTDGVPGTVAPSSTRGEALAEPEVSLAGHQRPAVAPKEERDSPSGVQKQSSVPVKQEKSVDPPENPRGIEAPTNNSAISSSETAPSSDEDPSPENLATPEWANDHHSAEAPRESGLQDTESDPIEPPSSARPETITSRTNRTSHTKHTNLTRRTRRARQPNGPSQSTSTEESAITPDLPKPDLPHDSGCTLDPCDREQDTNPDEERADSATGDWRVALLQERPASTTDGVKAGWTRKTELFRIEHVTLLKALAWWERRRVRDLLEEALEHYWTRYSPDTIQKVVREYAGTEHNSID